MLKVRDTPEITAIPGTPVRTRSRAGAALMTAALAFITGTALLEVVLRLFVPVTDVAVTMFDPVLGPRIAPNQGGNWIAGQFINARYHFNAQGWNHPRDYEIARPANTIRVCIVGDSQVESLQVDPSETM